MDRTGDVLGQPAEQASIGLDQVQPHGLCDGRQACAVAGEPAHGFEQLGGQLHAGRTPADDDHVDRPVGRQLGS